MHDEHFLQTFTPLVDCIGLTGNKLQPIEFLIDQKLAFQSSEALIEYKVSKYPVVVL